MSATLKRETSDLNDPFKRVGVTGLPPLQGTAYDGMPIRAAAVCVFLYSAPEIGWYREHLSSLLQGREFFYFRHASSIDVHMTISREKDRWFSNGDYEVTVQKIVQARSRLRSVVHRTPLQHSRTFSEMTGMPLYMKLECLQRTGAFKLRGAYNKIALLSDVDKRKGIVTASAGNHAQGVACAAAAFGVRATIVMPQGAPQSKRMATEGYGSQVVLAGESYDEAYAHALMLSEQNGFTFVHAFDDPDVIAGQGTIGLDIVEELPDIEAIVVPIGGGGLISGIAMAAKTVNPAIRIVGVQPEQSNAAFLSVREHRLQTIPSPSSIADGLNVKRPGELPFAMIERWVDEVVTVPEEAIKQTMLLYLERAKLLVEGAGAASLAALLNRGVSLEGKRTAVIVSGGNVDLTRIGMLAQNERTLSVQYTKKLRH